MSAFIAISLLGNYVTSISVRGFSLYLTYYAASIPEPVFIFYAHSVINYLIVYIEIRSVALYMI